MKISARSFAALVICVMLACSPARASIILLSGTLNAAQVVDGGGSTSTATGFGEVAIDTTLFTITTDLSWSGLSGPADRAHLHDAPSGQSRQTPPNGDFFHEVLHSEDKTVPCPWSGISTDCLPVTGSTHDVLQLSASDGYGFSDFDSLVADFQRNGVYLDLHTELYDAGEIRGQLIAAVPESSSISLFGLGGMAIAIARRRKQQEQLGI